MVMTTSGMSTGKATAPATFLALWTLSCFLLQSLAEDFCACRFNVSPASEDGCRVYGKLSSAGGGDDELVPWYRGSQDCLDAWNIRVRAIDEFTLEGICPADGEQPNVNALINFLRFQGGAAADGIKLSYPQFFVQEGNQVVFVDEDCESDASTCWNNVRDFFAANPDEMVAICTDLYNRAANDLELEQSTLRIRLCQEDVTAECEPLWSQVNGFAVQNPSGACSDYGFGPAGLPLPDAETCVYDDDGGRSQTPTSGSRTPRRTSVATAVVGLFSLLIRRIIAY
jgi:hypothetical protein